MRTYYCTTIEEALQRAKAAAKRPLHFYGSIILPSGRKGFAVYKDGKVLEQYSYMNKKRSPVWRLLPTDGRCEARRWNSLRELE